MVLKEKVDRKVIQGQVFVLEDENVSPEQKERP